MDNAYAITIALLAVLGFSIGVAADSKPSKVIEPATTSNQPKPTGGMSRRKRR